MRRRTYLTGTGKLVLTLFVVTVSAAGIGWCVRDLIVVEKSRQFARRQQERSQHQDPEPDVMITSDRDPVAMAWPAAREALTLLRMHESLNGRKMIGDRGRARGWLQQHEDHWYEGCEMLGVDGLWPEDTDDLRKCEDVAIGYWMIYARKYLDEGDVEELIRRFRLPNNPYRDDNNEYLLQVLGEE